MTMRNAVPRFGMRAAVVLAVLAVVALAALLAVGSPASAQSSDVDEIFSATMTASSRVTTTPRKSPMGRSPILAIISWKRLPSWHPKVCLGERRRAGHDLPGRHLAPAPLLFPCSD